MRAHTFVCVYVCVYFPEMLQFLFHASLRSLSTIVCSSPVPCLFLSLVVSSLFSFFDTLLFCFPSLLHFIFPATFTTSKKKKPLLLHLVSSHLSHSTHFFCLISFAIFSYKPILLTIPPHFVFLFKNRCLV